MDHCNSCCPMTIKSGQFAPIISIIIIFKNHSSYFSIGAVTISPSGTASVNEGDELELICTTTGIFLEWCFSLTPEGGTTARIYKRFLTTSSPSNQTSQLQVNSITFTFSRISGQNSLPLVSRLLISPVSKDLNGTGVNRTDLQTSERASALVYLKNQDQTNGWLKNQFCYRV